MARSLKVKDLGYLSTDDNLSGDPLDFIKNIVSEHGDYVRYQTRTGKFILLNHPTEVQGSLKNNNLNRVSFLKLVLGNGLLTSEGDFWRQQRKIATPHFTCTQVLEFGGIITEKTQTALDNWQETCGSDHSVDLTREFSQVTLDVILQALFGYSLGDQLKQELHQAITTLIVDLSGLASMAYAVDYSISGSRQRSYQRALETVDEVIKEILDARSHLNHPPNGFLGSLLSVTDGKTGKPLSHIHIRDEIVTMIIAGHETTAVALSWTWYMLSKGSEESRLVYDEIDSVVGTRLPTMEDLPKLEKTTWFIKETMRIYPPVWNMRRQATKQIKIGRVELYPDEAVVLCPYTTHRHPEFWTDPDSFDPGRFSKSRFLAPQQSAYFPFGGGRHLCLGIHFAMMEAITIVAMVAQRFKMTLDPNKKVEADPGMTLRMRSGMHCHLEPR